MDTGRPALKQCLEFLRDGHTLLVTKIDRLDDRVKEIRSLRESGETVPTIIKRTGFSKASIYRALERSVSESN